MAGRIRITASLDGVRRFVKFDASSASLADLFAAVRLKFPIAIRGPASFHLRVDGVVVTSPADLNNNDQVVVVVTDDPLLDFGAPPRNYVPPRNPAAGAGGGGVAGGVGAGFGGGGGGGAAAAATAAAAAAAEEQRLRQVAPAIPDMMRLLSGPSEQVYEQSLGSRGLHVGNCVREFLRSGRQLRPAPCPQYNTQHVPCRRRTFCPTIVNTLRLLIPPSLPSLPSFPSRRRPDHVVHPVPVTVGLRHLRRRPLHPHLPLPPRLQHLQHLP